MNGDGGGPARLSRVNTVKGHIHIQCPDDFCVVHRAGSVMLCTWGARGACAICKSNPPGEVFGVEPRGDRVVEIVEYGVDPTHLAVLSWLACVTDSPLSSGDKAELHRRTSVADRVNLGSAIGAGDTFIAGVLYGLWCVDGVLHRTLRFAVDLATAKVGQDGLGGLASKVRASVREPREQGWVESA